MLYNFTLTYTVLQKLQIGSNKINTKPNSISTDLLTTSFQPSSLFWLLLGLVRLSLLLGEVTGRAIVLNGDGRELEVEMESMVSETL